MILSAIIVLAYVVYLVPSVLTTTAGGITLALVLSLPAHFLMRFMRRGLAILLLVRLLVLADPEGRQEMHPSACLPTPWRR